MNLIVYPITPENFEEGGEVARSLGLYWITSFIPEENLAIRTSSRGSGWAHLGFYKKLGDNCQLDGHTCKKDYTFITFEKFVSLKKNKILQYNSKELQIVRI